MDLIEPIIGFTLRLVAQAGPYITFQRVDAEPGVPGWLVLVWGHGITVDFPDPAAAAAWVAARGRADLVAASGKQEEIQ